MENINYNNCIEIIQKRAKSCLSQIRFFGFIAFLALCYGIYASTRPDFSGSLLVLWFIVGSVFIGLACFTGFYLYLYKVNRRNIRSLDISYLDFNRTFYIRGNRVNQYLQAGNIVGD